MGERLKASDSQSLFMQSGRFRDRWWVTVMSVDLRPEPTRVNVPLGSLAWAFFLVGVSGFGGVAAPAHAIIVERRRWLSNESYAAVIGVGQVLPGANMMNASVILGDRFAGPLGSLVAATSLLSGPLCILMAVALAFDRWGRLADVSRFNSSPEVIRLVVMMYVRYPLSLRNVEDLLHERGIEVSHEAVRIWWTRFDP